jgi:hypothetical protein
MTQANTLAPGLVEFGQMLDCGDVCTTAPAEAGFTAAEPLP